MGKYKIDFNNQIKFDNDNPNRRFWSGGSLWWNGGIDFAEN